ncbi:transmembrane protein 126A [Notothenia coriiceps]|uniref:Transmembrane protein 126A n=1 Tax=Notothenia coriiceps TaxID=8208 RepID=A0A6I9PPT2_9TELE|nr:PREDICTED: transmembrane protein 126A-like [Notothenia coriiceps]
MSENTQKDRVSGNALTGAIISEMLGKNFERLPDFDKKLFLYGPLYLAGNGALAGLISNSLYRRGLNVTQAAISSSLPLAVMPFLTTFALYNGAVSGPLLSGDLNCPTCALIRGALVGVFGGGLYPILLALPVNFGLASRYNTAPMPEKGNMFRYWMDLSKPVLRKMRAVILLQAVFGTYLASRHFDTYTKLAELTFDPKEEELKD